MSMDSIGFPSDAGSSLSKPLRAISTDSKSVPVKVAEGRTISSRDATSISFTLNSLSDSLSLAVELAGRSDPIAAKRLIGLAKTELSSLIGQLSDRLARISPDVLSRFNLVESKVNKTLEDLSFGFAFEEFPKKVALIREDLIDVREMIEKEFKVQTSPPSLIETISDAARDLAGSRAKSTAYNTPPYAVEILNTMSEDPARVLKAQGSVDFKRVLEIVGNNGANTLTPDEASSSKKEA